MTIKKVTIKQLTPGMFIHDLNCGWLDHPFARNQFKIDSMAIVGKIRKHGIREVYIDTARGLDVPDAPSQEDIDHELAETIDQVMERASPEDIATSLEEELLHAKKAANEASRVVTSIMDDVRLGRQVDIERVDGVVDAMVASILRNKDAMLSLGRIRSADEYTFQHSVSVAALMIAFARDQGNDHDKVMEIGTGALLHDIGKMKTPDHILNKPGKLSEEEFSEMRMHVVYSDEILRATEGISADALAVAAQHHERFDGTGYPHGLAGNAINHFGQMAAIVDVYDAISSDRCYHKGQEPTAVLKKLLEWGKYHFNETLVHQFIRCVGIYPVGTLVRLESGRLAVVVESGERGPLYPVVRAIFDTRTRSYLSPVTIDLSNPDRKHAREKIVSYENETDWGIKPYRYLV